MTKNTGVGRGGKRPGAGRKTADGAVCVASITIKIDAQAEEVFRELGGGNYSLGARRAVAELISLRKKPATLQSISKPQPQQASNPFLRRK